MERRKDITGQRFGRLVAVRRVENAKSRNARWLCKCDCGNEKIVYISSLRSGDTISCGCYAIEVNSQVHKKHGGYGTRLHHIWTTMKARCFNENNKAYKNYGGRGITVCDGWKNDFAAFRDWAMANGYREDLTLDRIDVNGPYSPENCRWATPKEQGNNRRNNRIITYNGKSQTMAEWADELGTTKDVIYRRLWRGWPESDAVSIPVKHYRRRK